MNNTTKLLKIRSSNLIAVGFLLGFGIKLGTHAGAMVAYMTDHLALKIMNRTKKKGEKETEQES